MIIFAFCWLTKYALLSFHELKPTVFSFALVIFICDHIVLSVTALFGCGKHRLFPDVLMPLYNVCINSFPPSATHVRQWTGPALVQVLACRLFGAKPLPEPMPVYCRLNSWEQISVKFEWELYHFHSRKCIWNCPLPKRRPFCPGEMS